MAHQNKTSVSRRHVVPAASATLAAASLASSTAKGNADMAEQAVQGLGGLDMQLAADDAS